MDDNGLGEYMQLANLTVVGALILTIVVCTIFLITRGIPRGIEHLSMFLNGVLDRSDKHLADTQQQFIDALDRQAQVRLEAAKDGHDAARSIATELRALAQSLKDIREQK